MWDIDMPYTNPIGAKTKRKTAPQEMFRLVYTPTRTETTHHCSQTLRRQRQIHMLEPQQSIYSFHSFWCPK